MRYLEFTGLGDGLEIVQDREDLNVKMAQMVQLLCEIGPDIPEIARRLGQYKESVRYRYKEKILKKGFVAQAVVDYAKLGLKRIIMIADFADEYSPYAQAILIAMNNLAYVNSFTKTLPNGLYIVHASVPEEYVDSFIDFIQKLKEKKFFKSIDVLTFDYFRNVPMRAEFYDFKRSRWDFDWSTFVNRDLETISYVPSRTGKFDKIDLLIIEELQIDVNKSMTEIANKLNINYKKLAWHYSMHVVQNRLIKGYNLRWMGTRYDYKSEKALHKRHKYLIMDIIAKELTDIERMQLMSKINNLPFTWAEVVGQHYFAELAFPVDSTVEMFQYLEDSLRPLRDRAHYYIIDQTNALTFTIPQHLYYEDQKRWVFDPVELISKFENLIVKIKEGAS
jgi:hypothetical protein